MAIVAAILVEGRSDAAAVRAAAGLLGHDLNKAGIDVVPIGGAMAIRNALAAYGPDGEGLQLAGLVDIGEVRHTCRALFGGAEQEPYEGALAGAGFFVCDRDLEDELIRALGVSGVQRVLAERGDLDRSRTFQHQPAHRDEPDADQLRRFLGTTAGRKIAYATHLVEALSPATLPAPLRDVVEHAIATAPPPAAGPEYEVEFRWKEQIYYWEGDHGLYLDGGWGVRPTVTYVPSAAIWDDVVPEWARGRREQIVQRLIDSGPHRVVEGDYRPGTGVTR